MHSFCTLFDSYYLVKGLTMYNSLLQSGDPFTLYIFCFDDLTLQILNKLDLVNVVLISLGDFESEALKKIKQERTTGEYCWTCTPHIIQYILDKYRLPSVTYVDADLFFFNKPSILLAELERTSASVLITEHRYTPKYDQSKAYGIYCVQFITFKSDTRGLQILQWWQDRCLEWCYARAEDGKFGDQKYLDDWPYRFQGVHVLAHLGGGVAPWNIQQYRVTEGPLVNTVPVIFYHFHYMTWYYNGLFDLGSYKISKKVKRYIYEPYLSALEEALRQIQTSHGEFTPGRVEFKKPNFHMLRVLKRGVYGRHNVIQR